MAGRSPVARPADVYAHAAAIARAIGPGGPCLVLCQGRAAFAASLLACASLGRVVLLPASPAAEALLAAAREVELVLRDDSGDGLDVRALPPVVGAPAPDLPAGRVIVWLSTSGSTGEPRRVPKTAGQLFGEARALAGLLGVGPDDRVLATVPPMHVYGLLLGVLVPLVSDAALLDDTPSFPDTIAALAAEATVLVSVPTQLRAVAQAAPSSLGHLRAVVSSGAPLLASTAAAWRALAVDPTELLGSTETGGVAWRRQLRDPAWRPLPGVTVTAVDGRMYVDSPFLAPEGPRPWPSDDSVELDGDGFHHLGRLDDVVKVAGRRVSIAAVTRALLDEPGVEDAYVLAIADEARGTALHALVVSSADDLHARLRDRLSPLPRVHRVASLPREPNGKLPAARAAALLASLLPPNWQVDGEVARGALPFPPDHPSTRGHFPGSPLIPGAATLDAVDRAARRAWPDLGALTAVELATFTRPVLPGTAPACALRRDGDRVQAEVGAPEVAARAVLRYG